MKKQLVSIRIFSIPFPLLLLSMLGLPVLMFSLTGCNTGPQWRYQGEHFPQDVKAADVIHATNQYYTPLGTLKGRAESTSGEPELFQEEAARQAARRGGHAILHISGHVGRSANNPNLFIRSHTWSVFRKKMKPKK